VSGEASTRSSAEIRFTRTAMKGYAGARHAVAQLASISSAEQAFHAIDYCRRKGLTVGLLGTGCSFGDSYLNDGGVVLDLTGLDRIESWNPATGILRCQAGVSIAEILRRSLPDSWILPAIPGSLTVTIGGAIAHNVHGKDSCQHGNFGLCILRLTMITARGEILELSRQQSPDLFRAVVGGLGLLGIILSAELQLVKIPSQTLEVETRIAGSMAQLIADVELSVERGIGQAWIDAFAGGPSLGRGFTKLARFVGEGGEPADPARMQKSLEVNTHLLGVLPAQQTWRLARPLFMPPIMALVNSAYFWKAKAETKVKGTIENRLFTDFYFFHNNIPDFYSVYNPPGFAEIQCLFPLANCVDACAGMLALAHRLGIAPVLSGMKRHKPDDFLISFEGEGCAISFDFHLRGRNRAAFDKAMRQLFEFAATHGGRVNLSKDSDLPRDLFQAMYPRHGEFWNLKQRVDPDHLFISDMARRLLA
jgi:decaprenylphospho-beta-D-ribofuranose 2-oxidase